MGSPAALLVLSDPRAIENPFYLLAPGWLHYPMVAFATVATIIASQAIISGAYSLTQQAIQCSVAASRSPDCMNVTSRRAGGRP